MTEVGWSKTAPAQPSRVPPRCPVCDAEEFRVVFSGLRDRQFDLDGDFTLWECGSCGVRRIWPVPEDLARYYPDPYGPHQGLEGLGPRRPWHPLAWRLSFSRNSCVRDAARARIRGNEAAQEMWAYLDRPPRSVLDYGCGSGRFLARLDQIRVPGRGVDFSPAAVERVVARGLRAQVGSYEDLPEGLGVFDVVHLGHVLEHLTDPVTALSAVRAHVAPGGRLAVAVPNAASALAVIFGADWYQLDAPRHLWGFDEPTLRRVFERAGLEVERVVYAGQAGAIYQSLRYALESAGTPASLPDPPDSAIVHGLEALADEWNGQQEGDAILMIGSVRP